MINLDLSGQVIVIAGASSGIGRACARACLAQGAKVIAIGRNEKNLLETLNGSVAPEHAVICPGDVVQSEDLKQKLLDCIARTGKITGLLYAAGIASTVPLRVLSPETVMQEYAVNAAGAFALARILASPKCLSPDGGSFVFIASASAWRPTPGTISYSATKGAMVSGCRAMAVELAAKHIRVNTISPGYVCHTGIARQDFDLLPEEAQNAISRKHLLGMGTPEDVAGAAVFLLSYASRWMTGSDLVMDGGYSLS